MRKFIAIVRAIPSWLLLALNQLRPMAESREAGSLKWPPWAAGPGDAASTKWRRGSAVPSDDVPTVLIQEVESRTADDVVEKIYLENETDRTYIAAVRARFFTTVDEETGQALHHGPAPTEVELAPGERAQIGDILGWEWDSALSLTIEFRHGDSVAGPRVSYDLLSGRSVRDVAGLGEVCEVRGWLLEG